MFTTFVLVFISTVLTRNRLKCFLPLSKTTDSEGMRLNSWVNYSSNGIGTGNNFRCMYFPPRKSTQFCFSNQPNPPTQWDKSENNFVRRCNFYTGTRSLSIRRWRPRCTHFRWTQRVWTESGQLYRSAHPPTVRLCSFWSLWWCRSPLAAAPSCRRRLALLSASLSQMQAISSATQKQIVKACTQ